MARHLVAQRKELVAAVVDSFFTQHRIRDLQDFPSGRSAPAYTLRQIQDLLDNDGRSRERLHDGSLSALNTPGDVNFPLTRKQGDSAHFPEISAYRIVELLADPRQDFQIEQFFGFFELFVEFDPGFFEDLDARAIESAQDVVEFGAVVQMWRQCIAQLVVELTILDEMLKLIEFLFECH
jgi:hypothetical protein